MCIGTNKRYKKGLAYLLLSLWFAPTFPVNVLKMGSFEFRWVLVCRGIVSYQVFVQGISSSLPLVRRPSI